jgi:hypothetical protein
MQLQTEIWKENWNRTQKFYGKAVAATTVHIGKRALQTSHLGVLFISPIVGNKRQIEEAKAAPMFRMLDNGLPLRSLGFKPG